MPILHLTNFSNTILSRPLNFHQTWQICSKSRAHRKLVLRYLNSDVLESLAHICFGLRIDLCYLCKQVLPPHLFGDRPKWRRYGLPNVCVGYGKRFRVIYKNKYSHHNMWVYLFFCRWLGKIVSAYFCVASSFRFLEVLQFF